MAFLGAAVLSIVYETALQSCLIFGIEIEMRVICISGILFALWIFFLSFSFCILLICFILMISDFQAENDWGLFCDLTNQAKNMFTEIRIGLGLVLN